MKNFKDKVIDSWATIQVLVLLNCFVYKENDDMLTYDT